MPPSVATLISFGSLTKLNYYGNREWFSISKAHREADWLKMLPKSSREGVKVMALTVNTHSRLNLTGRTWLAPVTLTGMRIVNSSYSSLGGSSFCLTRKRLQVCKMLLSGFNLAQISKDPLPWMKPSVGLNSK